MYKYYLKKASRQDVERTTVINAEAADSFFGVTIPYRDDSAIISLRYLPDNILDGNVIITKKQDVRIFIDRYRFKEGNILLFENTGNEEFSLSIKTSYDSDYSVLNSVLSNNYLLTNDMPKSAFVNIGDDPDKEYKSTITSVRLRTV